VPRPSSPRNTNSSIASRFSDPWFEVYKPVSNVFAIYEPHQAEEVISYLIVGDNEPC
jgi:hypothetical protein